MNDLEMGTVVEIAVSGEIGVVIGKANYAEGGTLYQVHYKAANGCSKTEWLYMSQLNRIVE